MFFTQVRAFIPGSFSNQVGWNELDLARLFHHVLSILIGRKERPESLSLPKRQNDVPPCGSNWKRRAGLWTRSVHPDPTPFLGCNAAVSRKPRGGLRAMYKTLIMSASRIRDQIFLRNASSQGSSFEQLGRSQCHSSCECLRNRLFEGRSFEGTTGEIPSKPLKTP